MPLRKLDFIDIILTDYNICFVLINNSENLELILIKNIFYLVVVIAGPLFSAFLTCNVLIYLIDETLTREKLKP